MTPNLNSDPLIEARGLDLHFGRQSVLSHVDVSVNPGEIVTLIGPNGAGKTTLVRILLGLVKPDAGTVRRRPGLVVGYLPQRFAIDPVVPLTVRRLLGLTRRASPEAMARVLDEVGADRLIDQSAPDLSGGELRRVLLARALLREPDLLVLDEPVQGVDVTGQLELYELISRIRARRGCGAFMVSHDLHVVMAATDRVICLNRHVCCSGRPETVSRHPEYEALFGAAARNLAVYVHAHDHHHDLAGEVVHEGSEAGASPDPLPPPSRAASGGPEG
ncbi:MAG: zinc ABC transporter ATP-binding protein ZnuC [Nitrospinota bacterium]|jgi:zinc transport system ATP-binding protein|nr:zinc ABC transporter ATP-binding protein ZnuC [Nitrospinota bacterium]